MESELTPLVEDDWPLDAGATRSQRWAKYLSKYEWYYPPREQIDEEDCIIEPPSLKRAWDHFEHVVLPRYYPHLVSPDDRLPRAPAKIRNNTSLYPVISSPEKELGDFGVGIGVYFYTLRMLAFIMLIAGIISLPLSWYYFSTDYNGENLGVSYFTLMASATCTDTKWEICPNCTWAMWDNFPVTYDRYARVEEGDEVLISFIKTNQCEITYTAGLFAYITLIFVGVSIFWLQHSAGVREEELDDAANSTSDYSVEVLNPPVEARDPDEWKEFFSQFGEVANVTVALDNEKLVEALTKRRDLMFQLEALQPLTVASVTNENWRECVELARQVEAPESFFVMDGPKIKKAMEKVEEEIETDLATRKYDVIEIFCVFHHQDSPKKAVNALAVSGRAKMKNDTSKLPKEFIFRDTVLDVVIAPEPDSVRWTDLDDDWSYQMGLLLYTNFVALIIISIASVVVVFVREEYGSSVAAIVIAGLNSSAPFIMEFGVVDFESHLNEGSRQTSIYYKVTAFLWMNTTILTAMITATVDTLEGDSDSLLYSIHAIFIADMVESPAIQYLDVLGNTFRHFLGPRARDQPRMNALFRGTPMPLSYKYTVMTNVLFLTFYFAVLFPCGFFLAALILAVVYWNDKFALLRSWAPPPKIGKEIAETSRDVFFTVAVMVYAIISSYNYATFPYDDACDTNITVPEEYVGYWNVTVGDGSFADANISATDSLYKYCDQNMLGNMVFPPIASNQPRNAEWMTEDQAEFSVVYGWTSIGIVGAILLNIIMKLLKAFKEFYFSPKKIAEEGFPEETFLGCLDKAYFPFTVTYGYSMPAYICDLTEDEDSTFFKQSMRISSTSNAVEANCVDELECLKDGIDGVFSLIKHYKPNEPPGKKKGELRR